MEKPSYSLSRRAIWINTALAWLSIFALLVGALLGVEHAVPMAAIVVPSAFLMIAALLGIHRAFGSMDLRAIAAAKPGPTPEGEQ